MSGAGRASDPGDQFYVTHCTPADSVRNEAGYTVRAASTVDPPALDAAFHYPPYELPFDMWRDLPAPESAPRRLARTLDPKGGVWAVHSAYIPKDTTDRDRSFFSHLLRLPSAAPLMVLRSWGAAGWVKSYPPGAPKTLPRGAKLPVGTLVNDDTLTAFLSDSPPSPDDLGGAVCPPRLRTAPAAARRDLLARALHAILLLNAEQSKERQRVFFHAEPGLVAMLLYGCARLLPPEVTGDFTFSTFEPVHRNIRNYRMARVVGTYQGPTGRALDAELGSTQGILLDTFTRGRSSPELSWLLPVGLSDLVEVAVSGQWGRLADARKALGEEDADAWIEEEVARVRSEAEPEDATLTVHAPARPTGPVRRASGSYSAQISRTNPACLLFLIDQSGSMAEPFVGSGGASKAQTVADAVNRLLQNVVLRSAKADGVRDYFRVGVIGYGKTVKAGLGGTVPFNVLIPVSKLGERPLRIDTRTKLSPDGNGGIIEQQVKFPVWFDPEAGGQTPMCEAFSVAGLTVNGFVEEFPNSYPPIILNLTDGIPSDGNPQDASRLIRNIKTADGNTLLFNLLISKLPVPPAYFPADETGFPDEFAAKLLFRMSSVLPQKLWDAARNEGHALKPGAKGVVINADPTAVVRFLDIGTRVSAAGAPAPR